ncbi:MAG: hypothetical protein ACFFD4_14390 [Candidatus Odinarchaeota archaeon]
MSIRKEDSTFFIRVAPQLTNFFLKYTIKCSTQGLTFLKGFFGVRERDYKPSIPSSLYSFRNP